MNSPDTSGFYYRTNNSWTQGFGFAYKWLAVDVSFPMPWASANPTKGTTKNRGIGIGVNGGKHWFRTFYDRNEGYYLEIVTDWDPEYFENNTDYPYRPDLYSSLFFLNYNYGFNGRKYSNKASMTQQDRQIKGAGSFTTGFTFSRSESRGDSSLVPKKYREYFSDTVARAKEYANVMYGLNIGYLRTIPLSGNKKWFLNLVLIPGIGIHKVTLGLEGDEELSSGGVFGAHVEARISLGFNGDQWYYGVMSRTHGYTNAFVQSSPQGQSSTYTRLYLGYKFKVKPHNSGFLKTFGL